MNYEINQHPNGKGFYIVNSENPFEIVCSSIRIDIALFILPLLQGLSFNNAVSFANSYLTA